MQLKSEDSVEYKRLFKIVRTDDFTDVPGDIIAADEISGECKVNYKDQTTDLKFGANGIRIVKRSRGM